MFSKYFKTHKYFYYANQFPKFILQQYYISTTSYFEGDHNIIKGQIHLNLLYQKSYTQKVGHDQTQSNKVNI